MRGVYKRRSGRSRRWPHVARGSWGTGFPHIFTLRTSNCTQTASNILALVCLRLTSSNFPINGVILHKGWVTTLSQFLNWSTLIRFLVWAFLWHFRQGIHAFYLHSGDILCKLEQETAAGTEHRVKETSEMHLHITCDTKLVHPGVHQPIHAVGDAVAHHFWKCISNSCLGSAWHPCWALVIAPISRWMDWHQPVTGCCKV